MIELPPCLFFSFNLLANIIQAFHTSQSMQAIHHWSSQIHPALDIRHRQLQDECRQHYTFPSTYQYDYIHQYSISSSALKYLLPILFARNDQDPRWSSIAKAPSHLANPTVDLYFFLLWLCHRVVTALI